MYKVSIIMPVYNEKIEWIKESIESIIYQTFKEFEFIIVLDNPKNKDIEALLESYKKNDKRIKILKNEKNIGLVRSLNRGLDIANGEFIARMDADDIAINNRIEKQINFLNENKDIGLIGCNWICIDEEGEYLFKHGILPTEYSFISKNLKFNNMFLHPSWMFRKEVLKKVNGYREMTYCEDYDFISRMITSNIKISNLNEYLMKYRVRKSSISISKAYEQFVNSQRVIKYMKQRLKNDLLTDDYNENKKLVVESDRKDKYIEATNFFIDSRKELKNKKYHKFMYKFLKSFLISRERAVKNFNIVIFNLKLFIHHCINN